MAGSVIAYLMPPTPADAPGGGGGAFSFDEQASRLTKMAVQAAQRAAQAAANHPIYAAGGAVVVGMAVYYRLK